jgi:hypothetical protein
MSGTGKRLCNGWRARVVDGWFEGTWCSELRERMTMVRLVG